MDAPNLSHASGIPIDKLAGEVYEQPPRKPQGGADPAKQFVPADTDFEPERFLDAIES